MSERETTIQAMADENSFTFYSSEAKWIRKIKRLAESHPKDVMIKRIDYDDQDENKEYSVTAQISKRFLKINPPRKNSMTEEQKIAIAERLKKARGHGTK